MRSAHEPMWNEYEACRAGIIACDKQMFRARFWHIAVTAFLLGGYLAVNYRDAAIAPGVAILAIVWIGASFWVLDAFSKTLQAPYIHDARDIEASFRAAETDYFGPTIALRFMERRGRALRGTIKNLLDASVGLFHLAPLIVATAVILAHSVHYARCFPRGCDLSWWDIGLATLAYVPIVAAILLSLSWRSDKPSRRYRFDAERRKQHDYLQLVAATLRPLAWVETRPKGFSLFRADFHGEGFAGFVDRARRAADVEYREIRAAYFRERGRVVVRVGLDGKVSPPRERLPARLQARHARLTELAPLAPYWRPDPALIAEARRRRSRS